MTNRRFSTGVDRALGIVGLFLILVVARLTGRAYSPQRTIRGRLAGFAARRAIDGIAAFGWMVDRLPLPAAMPAATRTAGPPAGGLERLERQSV